MFTSARENVNSYSIAERAINLPSYHDMTRKDLERVLGVIAKCFPTHKAARVA